MSHKKVSLVGWVEPNWRECYCIIGSRGYEWYRLPTLYKNKEYYRSPLKVRITIEEL
jgi:hypothetical protein